MGILVNPRPLSALELKLSGLIMESRVDTAGDNQNAHVIISKYHFLHCYFLEAHFAIESILLTSSFFRLKLLKSESDKFQLTFWPAMTSFSTRRQM